MAASPPSARPDPSTAVTRIALQVGATAVAHVDVGTMLAGVCAALPPAVGVAGAVLVLTEPADPRDPQAQQVFASDDAAGRLGLIQHRAGRGPVPAAVRGDRPLTVPDLTVSGPPELAAAAADCGLVRSLVVPVPVSGQPAGGLQLLAGADTALDERTAAVLWPLVSALSARLADARELARVATAPSIGAEAVDPADPDALPPETTAMATADVEEHVEEPPPDVVDGPGVDGPGVDGSADAGPEQTARLRPADADAAPDAGLPAAGHPAPVITVRDPARDLFADGEPTDDTPPTGQAGLGWEGPEHTPAPTPLPSRLPARVPVLGRSPRPGPSPRPVPRPIPAAVPAQRSGPAGTDPAAAPDASDPVALDPTVAVAVAPPEHETGFVAAASGPPAPDPGVDDGDLDGPTWRVPRHRLRDDA